MSQRFGVEAAMIECQRLWDETRDVNACVARYPQYESDIRQHFALVDALRGFKIPPASERRRQQGWQELGSLVAFGGTSRAPGVLRYAGIAAGLVLGVTAISAAGAATNVFEPPSPVSNLIEQLSKAKHLKRKRNDQDQRVVRLYLTASGRRLVESAPQPARGVLPDALESLDAKTLGHLDVQLRALLRAMKIRVPGASKTHLDEA